MKILLILAMISFLPSCGKRNRTKSCNNRETMQIKCQQQYSPNYGYQYAREICGREYSAERCY